MSEGNLARQQRDELASASEHDDADDSLVLDREPKAPTLTHLGRYRLVREIASGGMASVNLAVAEGLDKLVALKMIHPHLAQEESFVQMFLDEARIASSISHRNVCNVFDFGEAEGRFYIAMDYLAGQSLRDVNLRLRKLPVDPEPRRHAVYAAYILAEACEGLHAAHELHGSDGQLLNVVHRDVSPHNLFLTYDGNVSVVDFGIARASDRLQHTATGVLKGKFSYMAPEQVRQLEVDRRADVWALGVCLWESLTLERLFVRSSQADTLMSVMMDRVRPPSEARPEIPKELDAIVMRALARNPANRYATAREMGRDLMKFCREGSVMAGPVEIEQWMARMFANEIAKSKHLLRSAKQAASDGNTWLEMTPMGFPRTPTRSGAMLKVRASQAPVDLLIQEISVTGSATNEQAPRAEITGTEQRARDKRNMRGLVMALVALATAAGLLVLAPVRRDAATTIQLVARPVSAPAPSSAAAPSSGPAPSSAAVPSFAAIPQQVTPVEQAQPGVAEPALPSAEAEPQAELELQAEPEPEFEPTAEQPVHRAAVMPTHPVRPAPAHPQAAPSVSAAPRSALALEPATTPPETKVAVATRAEQKAPVVPTPVPNQPSPEASTTEPAPPSVSAPREAPSPAPAAVAPPTPKAPVKLDAIASIGDLDVDGSLGSGVVARMMSRAIPLMHSCYVEAAKRAGHNDFSPLSVSLNIDETGAVRGVEASRHPLGTLPSCVADALKRLRSDRKPDVGTVRVRLKVGFEGQ